MVRTSCPDELTPAEAYRVMLRFVADYRGRAGNDLATLLGGTVPMSDGVPGDPASPDDWGVAIRDEFGCLDVGDIEWPSSAENFRPDAYGRSLPFWAIPRDRLRIHGDVAYLTLRDAFSLAADFIWRFEDRPMDYLDEFIARAELGSDGRPLDPEYEHDWAESLGDLLDESPDALRRAIRFF